MTTERPLHAEHGPALLPYGVTGFSMGGETLPPLSDKRAIKSALHGAALRGRYRVAAQHWGSIGRNFHSALLTRDGADAWLLFNAHYHFVALTKCVRTQPLVFRDAGILAEAFASCEKFQFLTKDYLEQCVTPDRLALVNPAEIDQIRHWRPDRIGDIIFNFWD